MTEITTLTLDGLKPVPTEAEAAHVRVGLSFTKNIGSYQSVRFECTVETPCHRDEIVDVTDRLKAFVNQTVTEALSA